MERGQQMSPYHVDHCSNCHAGPRPPRTCISPLAIGSPKECHHHESHLHRGNGFCSLMGKLSPRTTVSRCAASNCPQRKSAITTCQVGWSGQRLPLADCIGGMAPVMARLKVALRSGTLTAVQQRKPRYAQTGNQEVDCQIKCRLAMQP